MSLTVFDAKADFLKRYSYQIKEALKDFTHFGMDGGLGFEQEHEVLDREEFRLTPLLKDLQGKAVRQLGSSGGGNHFVEFGEIALQADNVLNLPEGSYVALLSHSGSRGLGAAIANITVCWPVKSANFLGRRAFCVAESGLRRRAGVLDEYGSGR